MPNREIIFSFVESSEGGYEARANGHAIFTEAASLKGLKLMVREAVAYHFTEADRPRVIRLRRRKFSE